MRKRKVCKKVLYNLKNFICYKLNITINENKFIRKILFNNIDIFLVCIIFSSPSSKILIYSTKKA